MFVTMAMLGKSLRNDPSDSSASKTIYSPSPARAFEPKLKTLPPIIAVGFMPQSFRTDASIDEVVVLPCVPATPIPCLRRTSSASISDLCIMGMRRFFASMISGLVRSMALEVITTW